VDLTGVGRDSITTGQLAWMDLESSAMTSWAASLIPVGSLAFGSALTLFGQALSDRRTSRRERESRLDAIRVRRYEIERDTLLALQDGVLRYLELGAKTLAEKGKQGPVEDPTEVILLAMQLRMLAGRCLDRNAAEAVNDLCAQVHRNLGLPRDERQGWNSNIVFDLLGEALRRDPFP